MDLGGYFRIGNSFFVITAAHVTEGLEFVLIQDYKGDIQMGKVLDMPLLEQEDISVVLLKKKFKKTNPMQLDVSDKVIIPGEETFYTGFPSTHYLVSFTGIMSGYIIGPNEEFYLAINTYVWFGSSGSCVFDKKGNLIAIVSAIDVRQFYGPKPHTNLMWGKPVTKHIERQIKQAIKQNK